MSTPGDRPARHFLADLGMEAESIGDSGGCVRIPVTPRVTAADGGVRAGVLATLVDVVGGTLAARELRPDWMATADLTLQVVRPVVGPIVEARATVLRKGRTTLVIEASVYNVANDDADAGAGGERTLPVAWATMTFAILPGRSPTSSIDAETELPSRWAFTGSGVDESVVDALSISVEDAGAGRVSMPVRAYLFNSFGAVQGGVMAVLGEVAGAAAVGHAAGVEGGSVVVTDLQIAYLALGRVGPIVSRSRVLDAGGGDSRRSAVVELVDEGAGGRLTTVINVGAVSIDMASGRSVA